MFFKKRQPNKRIALTFDTELWHEGEWLKPYIGTDNPRDFFIESMTPILELLKNKKITATFFVTDTVLKKYPRLIKEMTDAGHEIGSHGIKHTRLQNLAPDTFEHDLIQHVSTITKITGKQPKGFRAPHFSLNNDTKWILPILARNGFQYDSSVFGTKTSEYGTAHAPQNPYHISFADINHEDLDSPLLEIPIPAGGWNHCKFPLAGGVYFRIIPSFLFHPLVRNMASRTTTPVLYFHPHELCAITPKINGPKIKTMLKYWGTNTSFDKFSKLTTKFQFTSIEKILQH